MQKPDPSLMIADPAEYQRQYEVYTDARLAQTLAQVAAPIAYSMADTGKALSQANSEVADVWKRWGPEVESLVAHIPPGNRNRAMWDQAAKFVRSNHVDELVEEKAREKAAQFGSAPATEGSSFGAPPAASNGSDVLGQFWNSDHPYAGMLKSQGINLTVLRDRISRMKVTPDNWLKSVNSSQIIPVASGGHRGFTTTQRAS